MALVQNGFGFIRLEKTRNGKYKVLLSPLPPFLKNASGILRRRKKFYIYYIIKKYLFLLYLKCLFNRNLCILNYVHEDPFSMSDYCVIFTILLHYVIIEKDSAYGLCLLLFCIKKNP